MPSFYGRYPYGYYSPFRFHNRNNYYGYRDWGPQNNLNNKNDLNNIDTKQYPQNLNFPNASEKKEQSETRNSRSSSNFVFEIFGIKLYFDDILLISLIFFLYQEGVQDSMLFMALILLLLS